MFSKSHLLALFVAGAAAAPVVSTVSDGQPQVPTSQSAISTISDGQPQAATSQAVVSTISDGQPQAATSQAVVSTISDGQPQAATSQAVVSTISDGQPQAPSSAAATAVSTISDGQPQASGSAMSAGAGDSSFGPDSQISASVQPSTSGYREEYLQSGYSSATFHGPYTGTPTTTGAANGPATLAASVGTLPPNPTATYYNTEGVPLNPLPAPYTPAGGLGTNGSLPRYMVESDFDFESIALGLYQEWIELDLFHDGLARFTDEQFEQAGLGPEARSLIEFMADQETSHATLLTNMLGERAPAQCYYDYPYTTVREWVDFMQRLTRFGESGVWGFINHLDSREVGQLLAQSIATEARQQMIFRQMSGLTPMDVHFENGWPQSWAWTMLAPYISYCPENETRLAWQNFPVLHILNNANINRYSPNDTAQDGSENAGSRVADPSVSDVDGNCLSTNVTGYGCYPEIAHNKSEPLSFPGKKVLLQWDAPGQAVGPNNSYITSTSATGAAAWVGWSNQLNLTYSPLTVTGTNEGFTYQPEGYVYGTDGIINGTMAIMVTDMDLYVTPFNTSMLNPHIIALGMYQAG